METLNIEVFSQEANREIVRMPGRHFPGMVLQGDTLSVLADHAENIYNKCRESDDEDLVWETKNLMESMKQPALTLRDRSRRTRHSTAIFPKAF